MKEKLGLIPAVKDVTSLLLPVFLVICAIVLPSRLSLLRKQLPPGPSLLSRVLDLWSNEPLSIKFLRWNKTYGSVVSVMDFVHFGKPTIVLGTPKAALDLLEKRGYIYSSRPRNIIYGEIVCRDSRGTLIVAGQRQRRFRTLMNAAVNMEASKKFRPLENIESKLLLHDLLLEKNTEQYHSHIRRAIHSVAFCTSYGRRLKNLEGSHVQLHARVERAFLRNFLPGKYLVDHFPVLLRLPQCLQWFRKEAERERRMEDGLFLSLLNQTKSTAGEGLHCAASYSWKKQKEYGFTDAELAVMISSPYTAGVATTLGEFEAFIAAMMMFPDVMRTSRKEVDSVVGAHRMPDFGDFNSLPYTQAVIKETLRWHPVNPIGVPHAVIRDDVYEGMFIPAGSTVIANIYGLTRDPEVFPEPEEFRPERFLDNGDPFFKNYNMTFGFGRRICPGQHVATDQLLLLAARILWAFDIVPHDNLPESSSQHGRFGPPPSLSYKLIPRSEYVCSIITEEALVAQREAGAWE